MNKATKEIFNLLKMMTGFLNNPFLKKLRLFNLHEKHLEAGNIPYPEGVSAINTLLKDEYLVKLTEEEVNIISSSLSDQLTKNTEKEIEDGLYSEEEVIHRIENFLIEYGISIDKIKESPDEDKSPFEILRENKKIVSNHAPEQFIKSPLIGNFFINNDIFLLLETLENGLEYDEVNHENLTTLRFDIENSTLYIYGYKPIKIKTQESKTTTREHSLLKYIFEKNNISEKYHYWQLREDSIHDVNLDDYYYRGVCKDINKKIKAGTDGIIDDFLDYNNENLKINNKYIILGKISPQLSHKQMKE